jgi:hypothetical protein
MNVMVVDCPFGASYTILIPFLFHPPSSGSHSVNLVRCFPIFESRVVPSLSGGTMDHAQASHCGSELVRRYSEVF